MFASDMSPRTIQQKHDRLSIFDQVHGRTDNQEEDKPVQFAYMKILSLAQVQTVYKTYPRACQAAYAENH